LPYSESLQLRPHDRNKDQKDIDKDKKDLHKDRADLHRDKHHK
jgi:hypothetical protein